MLIIIAKLSDQKADFVQANIIIIIIVFVGTDRETFM